MRLCWTKSKLPLSKIIRWVTGEDCSHFLIVLDDPEGGLIFEANLLGTHPAFYRTHKKAFTIVHEIDWPLTLEVENHVRAFAIKKFDGRAYDFLGVLYLGLRIGLHRMFGLAIPKKNKWAKHGAFYCDDLFDIMQIIPDLPKVHVTGRMITPHGLFERVHGKLNEKKAA